MHENIGILINIGLLSIDNNKTHVWIMNNKTMDISSPKNNVVHK